MVDLSSITHTARRSHQCAGCGLTVHTGERYVRAQVPGGGLLAKRAFHIKCYTAHLASASAKPNSVSKEKHNGKS